MKNKKKRLLIGSLIVIGMCFAAVKMDVLPVVSAQVNETIADSKIISYSQDNKNLNTRAVVSPDCTHLAFCKGTNEFFVQEISTGMITTYEAKEQICQVKYSPNGTYLVAGHNILNTKTEKVTQLATDAVLSSYCDDIAFSPDSEKLALINQQQIKYPRPQFIEIWDLANGQLMQKVPQNNLIMQMAFAQEGRALAIAGKEITLWDIQEGKDAKQLATHSQPGKDEFLLRTNYETIACSPNGKYLAAVLLSSYDKVSVEDRGLVRNTRVIEIWDIEQGMVVKTLTWDHYQNMNRLQFSPDGQYLASGKIMNGLDDKSLDAVWIWDVKEGKVVKKLTDFPQDVGFIGMDYSADGRYLSASSHWDTKIWKVK